MKRDKRIFVVAYEKVEPTDYMKGLFLKGNQHTLKGLDWKEAYTDEEMKDLCTYHTDPYVMNFKSSGTQRRWLELAEKYGA